MNRKQGGILLGCAAAVLVGLVLVVVGTLVPAAYLPLMITGGVIEAGGILVGLPMAFMDYAGNEKKMREYQKSKPPIEEVFEGKQGEKQDEKQTIVINQYNNSNTKDDERSL